MAERGGAGRGRGGGRGAAGGGRRAGVLKECLNLAHKIPRANPVAKAIAGVLKRRPSGR